MADIFLSYAREDRAIVSALADALEAAGFSVWWDALIESGSEYSEDTDNELKSARAVVVAWSKHSIGSVWVRDEAAVGRDQAKLFPVSLDGSEAPLGFRQFQTADFSKWRRGGGPEIEALAAALRKRLGAERPQDSIASAPRSPQKPRSPRKTGPGWRAAAVAGGLVAAALAGIAIFNLATPKANEPAVRQNEIEIAPFVAIPDEPGRRARAAAYAAGFSSRLTESGLKNSVAPSSANEGRRSEFVLSGQVVQEGDKELLAVRIDDRTSGASVWSYRGPPSPRAEWEANMAAFGLKCAADRRTPQTSVEIFSRYVGACIDYLDGKFESLYAAAKAIYEAAPNDANALGFFAFASGGAAWATARSTAEYERSVSEGKRLADMALALDPDNPDALFALSFQYRDNEYAKLEAALKSAIAADLQGWGLGRYANFLASVGRFDEAIDYGMRALQGRRNRTAFVVARQFAAVGDQLQSAALYDEMRPLAPEQVTDHETVTIALYGDVDEAERRLSARGDSPNDYACLKLVVAARRGAPYNAPEFAAACGGDTEWAARYFAIAGDLDAAYGAMEAVLAARGRFVAPQIFWPEFHDFLRDPRFFPLADRLGLVDYWLDTDEWPDFCNEAGLAFDCRERAKAARAART